MPISIKYPPTRGDLLYISTSPLVLCWMTYRKHVRVSLKTCTTFRENMYVFSGKDHSVFGVLIINVLYAVSFLRAYCTEFYWGSLYSSLAKTDG